ncbi:MULTISPECIES: PH domain-containing protein [Psychrilyobacter]|uniref:PH domain-containing protein n=1 Tax=Psychrilyobacter piezotolerans TaxID=2293438 RepID=A0ABX9KDQ0_9FUSO|nr:MULTISPECIES: PH domain-containing protein [Psychrilyobacter]MCS5422047.1 PH domain-containing protein [Psychrilyobacter sp. S5]NDI79004.1 PH domain-containing protein [Psychrilyobacter piezotolerans]RDE59134.1 PH domain-containing protein [Psychrilyobacter sp. S5]REI39701.1 PH domain-containing protein [Psychrilyobacter piezotolerans]
MTNNKQKFTAMVKIPNESSKRDIDFLLKGDEVVLLTYRSIEDMVFFTEKKLITLDLQKTAEKKIQYMCIPYSKIISFSVETTQSFDLDSELKFWLSGLGEFGISFGRGTDIREIITLINDSMEY